MRYKSRFLFNLYLICIIVDVNDVLSNYLQVAAKMVQPSSRREGFSSIPNVKWEDVGGLDMLRREFDRYIVRRIKYPDEYEVNH